MAANIEEHLGARRAEPLVILDIGSQNPYTNGLTYRALAAPAWKYIGADIVAGNNVDLVMPAPFTIPLADKYADAVISGQCLEHCSNPFKLVAEAARVLKLGGVVILTAPAIWPQHMVDYFRFLPEGMRALLTEAGLTCVSAYLGGRTDTPQEDPKWGLDCWGIGIKDA